jgi:hypothetical protein
MKKYIRTISIAVSALFISQVNAGVTVIDFDDASIVHGTIVDSEYSGVGVSITSINTKGTANTGNDVIDRQVAFNTDLDNTEDWDLEYDDNRNEYNEADSNPFAYTALEIDGVSYGETPGNILILQENGTGCIDGVCDSPDDEGGTNPAGYFEFTFDTLVDIISLDTFDIEDNGEFVIQFFANNLLVATRTESTLNGNTTAKAVGQDVAIFGTSDYTVQTGDNTLQTMDDGQFVRQLLNITGIDRMRIQLPGSGAIDNLAFRTTEVSAPASLGILSLALLLMIRRARK